MEVPAGFLVVCIMLSSFVATSYGVYFSTLSETLIVTASPTEGQGLTLSLTLVLHNLWILWIYDQEKMFGCIKIQTFCFNIRWIEFCSSKGRRKPNHGDVEIQPNLQSWHRLGLQDRKSQTLLRAH